MKNDYNWWKIGAKNPQKTHESIFSYIKYLVNYQSHHSSQNQRYMKMYGNYDIEGLAAHNYMSQTPGSINNRVTMNIVQSMVDTVTSKIGKNKPKPNFLTEGGAFSQWTKAKKLTKFTEGLFESTDFYEKRKKSFKDSCIFGTGAVKVFKNGKNIETERVFIEEIIVDDDESYYGSPRQMFQKKYIHKDVLTNMFPDKAGAINTVNEKQVGVRGLQPKNSDLVLVIEAWHLPSGEGAKDGARCVCIENETLLFTGWDKSYFPFIFDRWNERPIGFFGQGIAEQLQGLQREINKILRTIQVSMHLVSIPKVFVDSASKIVTSHLDNKIGGVIKYAGKPPIPGQLGSIPSELFNHLDRLYSRAFEIIGISQLSAQSQKPSGLDSGKALREFNDIESERFMDVGMRYEKGFIDAAKIMIDIAKDIDEEYADEGGFLVKVSGRKALDVIKWKDVDLKEDEYVMKVFPTSYLSSTPSGRLQDVQELLQAGFVDREQGIKLLDFPDLENFYDMTTSSLNNLEKSIELMAEDGKYQTPEPFQNLELGISKMQEAYLRYKNMNAPEKNLELLRTWMIDAKAMLDKAAQDQAPPAPAPAALPPGANDLPVDPNAIPQDTGALPVDPNAAPVDPATGLPIT